MKKLLIGLLVVVFATMNTSAAFAISRSSPSRSYSAPRPAPAPKPAPAPAPKPVAATPKPKPAPKAWSSSTKYGTGKSVKAGKRPLSSRTPKPEPHSFGGRTYRSSDAIYTNTSGNWVMYFLVGSIVGGVIAEGVGDDIFCFDEEHERVTCNRDDNSYQKDW